MKIKKQIANFMFKTFNTLSWGCPSCGSKVVRWSWSKAYCSNKNCDKTWRVNGL